jgi:polar amino acid transport system permease protein
MTISIGSLSKGKSDLPVPPGQPIDVAQARKRVSPGRWIISILLLAGLAWLINFVVTSPRLEWHVVGHYLFNHLILSGLRTTLYLAVVAQVIGTVLGVIFAVLRLSTFWPLRWLGTAYVTVFRSVPILLQLIFWFNLAYLFPNLSIGIPFGPVFASESANSLITPMVAAILGLSLAQGAYMTEIIRSGILSVGPGQRDASRALGLTPVQTFFRVTLPQAVRVVIPPSGSQFISVVHGSSLVSVIAVSDLLFSVQNVYERTYQIVPLLLVAVVWYLVVVLVLTFFQQKLERRFSRGHTRAAMTKSVLRRPRGGMV